MSACPMHGIFVCLCQTASNPDSGSIRWIVYSTKLSTSLSCACLLILDQSIFPMNKCMNFLHTIELLAQSEIWNANSASYLAFFITVFIVQREGSVSDAMGLLSGWQIILKSKPKILITEIIQILNNTGTFYSELKMQVKLPFLHLCVTL